MSNHFQLASFRTWVTPQGNTGILFSNSRKYYDILRDAFINCRFGPLWSDQRGMFDWGVHLNGANEEERQAVISLLELFRRTVCIDDALDQTFALDMHSYPSAEGGGRTPIGELVYQAKPYNRPPNEQNTLHAMKLAAHFTEFIACHPSYARADFLIPVPFFGQKAFDLPTFLANQLSKQNNIKNGQNFVQKIKNTKAMKNANEEEKFNIIQGAFELLEGVSIQDQRIILIDDIYQSGNTLHELGSILKREGATVLGLVATKTLRSFNQDVQTW